MTCRIESISCDLSNPEKAAKPKRESDGRRRRFAHGARRARSALAPRPFNPAPLCSLSLCSDSYL